MNDLKLYSLNEAARILGVADPKRISFAVQHLRVPKSRVGMSIVIDADGLARLRRHFAEEQAEAATA